MRGTSFVAAALLALGAVGTAHAQTEYITECVQGAVTQAQSAGDSSGYGLVQGSYCLLGGWIVQGHNLQYSMTLQAGHTYLFVGSGDRDVKDLDLSVNDGTNTVEDTETDNTPYVHVEAKGEAEVTITLTNYQGSGQPDFCCMIILEDEGGQANLNSLNAAATGLVEQINPLNGEWSTDPGSDSSSWNLLGGLFTSGQELGITRGFQPGTYMLVGWGDARAKDVDASVQNDGGETVAEDTKTDNLPICTFEVSGKSVLRGTLNLKMHEAKGNAFAVCTVLKQH